jgi:hypothetical protein
VKRMHARRGRKPDRIGKNSGAQVECMRDWPGVGGWEETFHKYQVSIAFAGHVHAYQRTVPVYKYNPDPMGTVHICIGDGGGTAGLTVTTDADVDGSEWDGTSLRTPRHFRQGHFFGGLRIHIIVRSIPGILECSASLTKRIILIAFVYDLYMEATPTCGLIYPPRPCSITMRILLMYAK